MDRCDIIPKWMFSHLQNLSKHTFNKEKGKLETQKRDNVQESQKAIAEEFIRGREADVMFEHNYSSSYQLKTHYKKELDKKQKEKRERIESAFDEEIKKLEEKYNKWESDILSGKIKRSDAKAFEVK